MGGLFQPHFHTFRCVERERAMDFFRSGHLYGDCNVVPGHFVAYYP
jgi:hypothetical protein